MSINYFAVLTSAAINLALGFVWFNMLFRQAYIAALDRTREQMAAGPSALTASIYQFIGFVVLGLGLAWLMNRTQTTSIEGGLLLAVIAWTAFFAAILGPTYAFQAFPLSMFGIVVGGYLLAFLVTGAILGLWR